MPGGFGLSRSAKRITGGRSVKGKICLSEASYFPFSGDTGNSALLLQPLPLLPPTGMPVALEGERGLRGEWIEGVAPRRPAPLEGAREIDR